ncbi:MAG: hypothetical protein ACR2IS_15070 [Nitrososphaeraceae archaeon]
MLRGLSFPFLLFVGIMSFLAMLTIGSDSDLFSLVNAEEEHQPLRFTSSSLVYGGDLYYAVFIKELENLIKNFEYTFDLEGSQIFPNNNIKQDIVSEYRSSDYNIDDLNYELLGFKITASDIKIHVDPKKIDDTKTRIDIPLLLAKDIKVSNGGLINLSYKEVDLGSVYGVYDKTTNKMTVHMPVSVATKYI